MIKEVEFKNNKKQILRGYVHVPKKYKNAFIHLHGFPGTMDSSAKRICTALSRRGILCMRFAFSGTPPSEGKFEDKLMSQEIKDVKYAIDYLKNNYKFKKLTLSGHSTGAIDAALYCSKDKRVNRIILSGAVCYLDNSARYDFTDRMVKSFWEKGYITYNNPGKWTHRKRIKKAFYDEFFKMSIPKSIKKVRRPLLIIHGKDDEFVPVKNAYDLFELANKPKRLKIIKGTGHSYSKPRPWKEFIRTVYYFVR